MSVHVSEMVSEVTTEPGSAGPASSDPAKRDEERARVLEAQTQIARDRFRTAAEGYDD
ncbi:MAG TPA: hypothetical protein VHQ64_14615 [Pyrinomonadaceae bacterium]|nr:hypothetical protein [Pyrinomonadaceae bacterium]